MTLGAAAMRIRVAGLTYDEEGNVVNWGQPNSEHLLQVMRNCRPVPCWRVLYVSAWVRDFPGVQGPHRGDQGWWYYVSFYVARWSAVRMVFDKLFATAGWYTRVSFSVETLLWTREEGWDIEDQL